MSEKVRPHHLERKALLYVRQSSAHQVLHNRVEQHVAVCHAGSPDGTGLVRGRGDRRSSGPLFLQLAACNVWDSRANGRRGLPRQSRRSLRKGGLALRPQQPGLAAAD